MNPTAARVLRKLPLAIVWLAVVWPFALWLLCRSDPELAVRTLLAAKRIGTQTGLGLLAVTLVLCLLYPPAPAGIRLLWSRMLLAVTSDRAPLTRAIAELEHFESAARHLEVGRLALVRNQVPLAEHHLVRAIELDDSIANAHHQLGLLRFRLTRYQEAAVSLLTALRLDPDHAFGDTLLHAGRCAFLLGDTATATRLLRDHERRHGGSRKSHLWLAETLQASGETTAATAALRYAAEPSKQRLTAEENWFRAKARAKLWGRRGGA
ncbi:MAG: tetratricopeptide repeat protein [Planctomycetes bacterium]|jgi:tetratricopeptide (TPR) repeat protein|nr:tetratricopeptide repeat protein [Planctomycetota bacterium]